MAAFEKSDAVILYFCVFPISLKRSLGGLGLRFCFRLKPGLWKIK